MSGDARPPAAEMAQPVSRRRCRIGASLWLVALVSLCVIIPRTLLIAQAHNETTDCEYHLKRGMIFLSGVQQRLLWNDPPLGAAILALPAWLTAGDKVDPYDNDRPVIYTHPLGPERLLLMTAGWKALLLVPLPLIVFAWCRALYGVAAAWLAVALLLVEPTFAAHTAYITLDMPGVMTIVLACWLGWRYLAAPTRARLLVAALAMTMAMLTKHTAIILPGVLLAYAITFHLLDRRRAGATGAAAPITLRQRLNHWAAVVVVGVLLIWPLMFFETSRPRQATLPLSAEYTENWSFVTDVINPLLDVKMPAGLYVGSVFEAVSHGKDGHQTYLLGKAGEHAPWYYHLVVATYKVPIGVAIVLLLGVVSLAWVRPRGGEWGLLIAALAWSVLVMQSGLGIGFRHFLPAYIFWLMLAARSLAPPLATSRSAGQVDTLVAEALPTEAMSAGRLRWPAIVAWGGIVAAAIHVIAWHPDYLSYINRPVDKPYLAISDSNIDWGQGLKQVRAWLEEHPQDRPVSVYPFLNNSTLAVRHYVGPDAVGTPRRGILPDKGLLIIGMSHVPGQYISWGNNRLKDLPPLAVIGGSMLVYDLDAIRAAGIEP